MTRIDRIGLLMAGASLIAATNAQAAEAENDERIIIVSVKQPGETILDYPGSVDVIGSDDLDDRQFQDLSSLSYAAPNVSLDPIGTFKGVANFAVRGLGINSSIPSIDPAVGLFVDGVYMGVNAGTVFDALDVDRVELLRGPQGVAFGRNTTGGAVLVSTGNPTWEWEGGVRAGLEAPVGNGRGGPMATARAVVSGPLDDKVAIRLGVLHSDDEGYFENDFDGSKFGKSKTTVLRGAITLKPSDQLTVTAKVERTDSSGDGAATHNNGQNARDKFDLSVNQRGFYDSESTFATVRADYDLGESSITNIFGWREYDLLTRNDIDSSPTKIFESDTGTAQEQWSNEIYYASGYGRLTYTVGAYIFHQNVAYDESRDLSGIGFGFQYGGGEQKHDVYGLYGQFDYDLTEQLTVTAGLRWSREEKDAAITYVRPRDPCSVIAGTCPTSGVRPGTSENNGFTDKRSWNSLSPRIAVSYKPSDNANVYASWTRGQRSGGYNLRITQPAAFEEVVADLGSPAFDEERVDSFELGLKWQSEDKRASINSAVFWTEVDGLQREVNVPSATSGLAQSVYNTADARIRGGEIEAALLVGGGLTLQANLGYTDTDYRRVFFDINSDGLIDSGDLALDLPRAPKWTWGGGATYETPLWAKATLRAAAFLQHRSKYAYTDNNWGFNSSSDRLDASLALDLGEPNITLKVYGKNLLDDVQFGGDTQLPFAGGVFSDGNNRPYDPNPAAGTFSPVFKGRVVGFEVSMGF